MRMLLCILALSSQIHKEREICTTLVGSATRSPPSSTALVVKSEDGPVVLRESSFANESTFFPNNLPAFRLNHLVACYVAAEQFFHQQGIRLAEPTAFWNLLQETTRVFGLRLLNESITVTVRSMYDVGTTIITPVAIALCTGFMAFRMTRGLIRLTAWDIKAFLYNNTYKRMCGGPRLPYNGILWFLVCTYLATPAFAMPVVGAAIAVAGTSAAGSSALVTPGIAGVAMGVAAAVVVTAPEEIDTESLHRPTEKQPNIKSSGMLPPDALALSGSQLNGGDIETRFRDLCGLNCTNRTGYLDWFRGSAYTNEPLQACSDIFVDNPVVNVYVPKQLTNVLEGETAKGQIRPRSLVGNTGSSFKKEIGDVFTATGLKPRSVDFCGGRLEHVKDACLVEYLKRNRLIKCDPKLYTGANKDVAIYRQSFKIATADHDGHKVVEFVQSGTLARHGYFLRDIDITRDARGCFRKHDVIQLLLNQGGWRLEKLSDDRRGDVKWRERGCKATILDNDRQVGRNTLTWRTTWNGFEIRAKVYNKTIFMIEKPSMKGKLGNNIRELIEASAETSRVSGSKEDCVGDGYSRCEVTFEFDNVAKYPPDKAHMFMKDGMATLEKCVAQQMAVIPAEAVLRCPHELLIRNWLLGIQATLICVDSLSDTAFICYGFNEVTRCACGVVVPPGRWSTVYKYVLNFNVVGNLPVHIITMHRPEGEERVIAKAKQSKRTEMKRYRHPVKEHGALHTYLGDGMANVVPDNGGDDDSSISGTSTVPNSAFAAPTPPPHRSDEGIKDDPKCTYKPKRFDLNKSAAAFTSELFHRVPHTFGDPEAALAHVCTTNFHQKTRGLHGLFGLFFPDAKHFKERLASFKAFMRGAPPLPTEPPPKGYKHELPPSLRSAATARETSKKRKVEFVLQSDSEDEGDEEESEDEYEETPGIIVGASTACPAGKRLKAPVKVTHSNPWKALATTEPTHAGIDAQLLAASEPQHAIFVEDYEARGFKVHGITTEAEAKQLGKDILKCDKKQDGISHIVYADSTAKFVQCSALLIVAQMDMEEKDDLFLVQDPRLKSHINKRNKNLLASLVEATKRTSNIIKNHGKSPQMRSMHGIDKSSPEPTYSQNIAYWLDRKIDSERCGPGIALPTTSEEAGPSTGNPPPPEDSPSEEEEEPTEAIGDGDPRLNFDRLTDLSAAMKSKNVDFAALDPSEITPLVRGDSVPTKRTFFMFKADPECDDSWKGLLIGGKQPLVYLSPNANTTYPTNIATAIVRLYIECKKAVMQTQPGFYANMTETWDNWCQPSSTDGNAASTVLSAGLHVLQHDAVPTDAVRFDKSQSSQHGVETAAPVTEKASGTKRKASGSGANDTEVEVAAVVKLQLDFAGFGMVQQTICNVELLTKQVKENRTRPYTILRCTTPAPQPFLYFKGATKRKLDGTIRLAHGLPRYENTTPEVKFDRLAAVLAVGMAERPEAVRRIAAENAHRIFAEYIQEAFDGRNPLKASDLPVGSHDIVAIRQRKSNQKGSTSLRYNLILRVADGGEAEDSSTKLIVYNAMGYANTHLEAAAKDDGALAAFHCPHEDRINFLDHSHNGTPIGRVDVETAGKHTISIRKNDDTVEVSNPRRYGEAAAASTSSNDDAWTDLGRIEFNATEPNCTTNKHLRSIKGMRDIAKEGNIFTIVGAGVSKFQSSTDRYFARVKNATTEPTDVWLGNLCRGYCAHNVFNDHCPSCKDNKLYSFHDDTYEPGCQLRVVKVNQTGARVAILRKDDWHRIKDYEAHEKLSKSMSDPPEDVFRIAGVRLVKQKELAQIKSAETKRWKPRPIFKSHRTNEVYRVVGELPELTTAVGNCAGLVFDVKNWKIREANADDDVDDDTGDGDEEEDAMDDE